MRTSIGILLSCRRKKVEGNCKEGKCCKKRVASHKRGQKWRRGQRKCRFSHSTRPSSVPRSLHTSQASVRAYQFVSLFSREPDMGSVHTAGSSAQGAAAAPAPAFGGLFAMLASEYSPRADATSSTPTAAASSSSSRSSPQGVQADSAPMSTAAPNASASTGSQAATGSEAASAVPSVPSKEKVYTAWPLEQSDSGGRAVHTLQVRHYVWTIATGESQCDSHSVTSHFFRSWLGGACTVDGCLVRSGMSH